MKKKATKWISITMTVMMAGFLLAGCAKNSSVTPTTSATVSTATTEPMKESSPTPVVKKEILPLRWVIPGNGKPDTEKVVDLINKKMQADGVNVQLKLDYIPWDAWEQKVNIMLSTGEDIGLIHTMDNYFPNTSGLVAKGAILPLDDLLTKYGPELKKLIPDYAWKQATMKGKIYALPAMWIDMAYTTGWITARKDLFDKYGIAIPKTPDELIVAAEALQKKIPEKTYIKIHGLQDVPSWLNRTFDSYPFYVKQGEELVMIDQKGNVKSWLESEEFKKESQYMRKLYTKGLLNPDILTLKPDDNPNNAGKFLFYMDRSFNFITAIKRIIPDADVANFKFNPEKPSLRELAYPNANTIPTSAKHPEAAVMFLNWLYSKQENMDLLCLGVKDTHWKEAGDRRFENISKDPIHLDYAFDWWQIGLMSLQRFEKQSPEEQIKYEGTIDDKAENLIGMGFNFDAAPVKAEYANCVAQLQSIYPIKWGVLDYDKDFPKAIDLMKKAGLDKVVAEYQKQFAEFIAK